MRLHPSTDTHDDDNETDLYNNITWKEVKTAINKCKRMGAAGENLIPYDAYIAADNKLVKLIQTLFNTTFNC